MPLVQVLEYKNKRVYDFGKELMAFLSFNAIEKGTVCIYYGESVDEAVDFEYALQTDKIDVNIGKVQTKICKAFRYICFDGAAIDESSLTALWEYLPLPEAATLNTNDKLINDIFSTSIYTLRLTMREFFIDGLKRDRWGWGGDFYQSGLMNYYSFFEPDIYRRTFRALIGKSPIKQFTNKIMDYSMLMLISLRQYYCYTLDKAFLMEMYGICRELLEFCETRRDKNGWLVGIKEDWIFIDWADLDNTGAVCAEQILYIAALKAFAEISDILNFNEDAKKYRKLGGDYYSRLDAFWDEDAGGFCHSIKNGKPDGVILRHANAFAILFDVCTVDQQEKIKHNILLNPAIPQIVTPYFKFFELEALCHIGEYGFVFQTIKEYWGKMLSLDATTFWEYFDEQESGIKHYEMYSIKYGRSLCHAWGAAPIYLIGRYILGIEYKDGKIFVEPQISIVGDFEAEFPCLDGRLSLSCKNGHLVVVPHNIPYEIVSSQKKTGPDIDFCPPKC